MARGDASGITVKPTDVPIIIGMIARGDRLQDIPAWFGLNQARIPETEAGKFGPPQTTTDLKLPPKGPPGPKGRELREAIDAALARFTAGDNAAGVAELQEAIKRYDADEG